MDLDTNETDKFKDMKISNQKNFTVINSNFRGRN